MDAIERAWVRIPLSPPLLNFQFETASFRRRLR
jgi:hypothetical protein